MKQKFKKLNILLLNKGSGCLYKGCLTIVAAMLLLVIGISIFGYFAYKQINQYTDSKPALPSNTNIDHTMNEAITQKVKSLKDCCTEGKYTTLTFDDADLNRLVSLLPKNKLFANIPYIKIEDNLLKIETSIAIKNIPVINISKKLKKRFINGIFIFSFVVEEGIVDLKLENIMVKKAPIPKQFLHQLQKINFNKIITEKTKFLAIVRQVKSAKIQKNKIIIITKKEENNYHE